MKLCICTNTELTDNKVSISVAELRNKTGDPYIPNAKRASSRLAAMLRNTSH